MSSVRKACAFVALSLTGAIGSAAPAFAQAWGEQAPVQFKYSNQGVAEEVYRNQLGAADASAAAAAAAASGGAGNGQGQASSQLNNAVQLNSNDTYNITIAGSGNYLNVGGGTVDATQSSTGTKQTSSNSSGPSAQNGGSSSYINR